MKRRLFIFFLIVMLAGCGSPAPTTPPINGDPLHMLVAIQGQAELKRSSWQSYAPALFGTVLRAGDLLRVSGRAVVVCADLHLIPLTDYSGGVPCSKGVPALTYHGVTIPAPRAPSAQIPLVITPVGTQLMGNRPLLRWTAADGASGYMVRLLRGSEVVWEHATGAETTLAYPADAPALQSGVTYQVVVAVAGDEQRSSQQAQSVGGGISLLPDDEAQQVTVTIKQIAALGLDEAGRKLLTASLYRSHRLYAEAIGQLDGIADAPAVLRQQGDLYSAIGLATLAEAAYRQALDRATELHDLEGQALAQRTLGELAEKRGDSAVARQHLAAAQAIYETLGDSGTVQAITTDLAALPAP